MSAFDDLLASIGDSQVPGGCDLCDAYQTVEEVVPNVYSLTVHHDDDCPTWRAVNAGAN
jgi:hypothetical protein